MASTRLQTINALRTYYQGQIEKHKANVEIYLTNPVGIGEHSDILGAMEVEINMIAQWDERLQVLERYFTDR
tara:strand:+ start:6225 stop:6440 length:216 start_codon:yes stop_codon:yes gene_type:complete